MRHIEGVGVKSLDGGGYGSELVSRRSLGIAAHHPCALLTYNTAQLHRKASTTGAFLARIPYVAERLWSN